jgi:hypothetical protein
MKQFLIQICKFLSLPAAVLSLLLGTYLYYDPFKVVYNYDTYYTSGEPRYIALNNDYIAVEMFLNQYATHQYNSFIIGNSRSRFYQMDTWGPLIGSDKCFHFDASNETLFGIEKKIEFLHQQGTDIKNVLLVIDHSTLTKVNNSEGHLYIKHPLLTKQNSREFHLEFFRSYCSFDFLSSFWRLDTAAIRKEYTEQGILSNYSPMDYNPKYNETKLSIFEEVIKNDPQRYYSPTKMTAFYQRDTAQQYAPQVIKKQQLALLENIRNILRAHKTNVNVVISPLYDQINLNPKDVAILQDIFGADHVFDFSGINAWTSDYRNYYEVSHYRPHIADSIMRRVYRNK